MILCLLVLATLFLAYSNGANDNFKGVATLFGSRTTNYKTAIWWATATTFAGSIVSAFLATTLVKNFSGKGLVPDLIADTSDFRLAVALAAGLTVIIATLTGFPISTTHGLTGALIGAGLVAIGSQINLAVLQQLFLLPLLLSPIVAILSGVTVYLLFHYLRMRFGIQQAWCLCLGQTQTIVPVAQPDSVSLSTTITIPELAIAPEAECTQRYIGKFLGINSQQVIDAGHLLSAGVVSFARGLNDTPKMVSLLLIIQAVSIRGAAIAIALAMAIGGWLNARKVAEVMSKKITKMNAGQGFSANLVTGILVIAASTLSLPVSTTHVSVGSIFGVGLVAKTANARVFYQILLSWLLTLPIAAIFSATLYWVFHNQVGAT